MTATAVAVILLGALLVACAPSSQRNATRTLDAPSSPAESSSGPEDDVNVGVPVAAVPVAPPTHLTFLAAGIDGDIEEYTVADAEREDGINPPRLDSISWYSGVEGALPGSDATNTVYLFGHTWTQPAVFNGLRDVTAGDEASVSTQHGVMTYRVDEVITMAKSDFSEDPRVAAVAPGRLALVSCHRPAGLDAGAGAPENIVVFLHLVGARPLAR